MMGSRLGGIMLDLLVDLSLDFETLLGVTSGDVSISSSLSSIISRADKSPLSTVRFLLDVLFLLNFCELFTLLSVNISSLPLIDSLRSDFIGVVSFCMRDLVRGV